MWKKIRGMWCKYISNQYAIKRNVILYWFIYSNGEKKVKKGFGQAELLLSSPRRKDPIFDRSISNAIILRGVIAHYYKKKFAKRYENQFSIELVKKNDLIFITDITGISGN